MITAGDPGEPGGFTWWWSDAGSYGGWGQKGVDKGEENLIK